jgi:nitrite reductase/ring-hydroxylating ferredoxin subunit
MRLLCEAGLLLEGGMRRIGLPDRPAILLYRVAGAVYATTDRCSHAKVFLSRGTLEGFHVICPAHFGSFDIRTGEAVAPPCVAPIETHRVLESEGAIYLVDG